MIEGILLTHFERYPRMEAQDAVKLIYQQEFGPEHMIRDAAKALEKLRQEMDGLTPGKHTLTLTIDNNKLHDISVDNLAHSYTNDTQIMWNGVLGRMELSVAPEIGDVQVYPEVDKQQARIKVSLLDAKKEPQFMNVISAAKWSARRYVMCFSAR